MNIAVILDCISDNTTELINCIKEKYDVCVFLPEEAEVQNSDYTIRKYNPDFDTAAFYRYDAAVFMAEQKWELLLPFIEKVKGAVIISSENPWYEKISEFTEYIVEKPCLINENLSSMPEYVMWFDRTDKEILSRIRSMGLATEKILEIYHQVYSYDKEI